MTKDDRAAHDCALASLRRRLVSVASVQSATVVMTTDQLAAVRAHLRRRVLALVAGMDEADTLDSAMCQVVMGFDGTLDMVVDDAKEMGDGRDERHRP